MTQLPVSTHYQTNASASCLRIFCLVIKCALLLVITFVAEAEMWWLFPRMRGFWENVKQFIPHLRFFFFFFLEICLCTLIPLRISPQWLSELRQCDRVFHHELHASLFPDRISHCLNNSIVSPLQFCLINAVCMFCCNLAPALLAE